MKNVLMIEYSPDSDSALTDDGTNKLIIKGLITSQQTRLHTLTYRHIHRAHFSLNVTYAFVIIINIWPWLTFLKSWTKIFVGQGYLKYHKNHSLFLYMDLNRSVQTGKYRKGTVLYCSTNTSLSRKNTVTLQLYRRASSSEDDSKGKKFFLAFSAVLTPQLFMAR